jgi:hypothetical protein
VGTHRLDDDGSNAAQFGQHAPWMQSPYFQSQVMMMMMHASKACARPAEGRRGRTGWESTSSYQL